MSGMNEGGNTSQSNKSAMSIEELRSFKSIERQMNAIERSEGLSLISFTSRKEKQGLNLLFFPKSHSISQKSYCQSSPQSLSHESWKSHNQILQKSGECSESKKNSLYSIQKVSDEDRLFYSSETNLHNPVINYFQYDEKSQSKLQIESQRWRDKISKFQINRQYTQKEQIYEEQDSKLVQSVSLYKNNHLQITTNNTSSKDLFDFKFDKSLRMSRQDSMEIATRDQTKLISQKKKKINLTQIQHPPHSKMHLQKKNFIHSNVQQEICTCKNCRCISKTCKCFKLKKFCNEDCNCDQQACQNYNPELRNTKKYHQTSQMEEESSSPYLSASQSSQMTSFPSSIHFVPFNFFNFMGNEDY